MDKNDEITVRIDWLTAKIIKRQALLAYARKKGLDTSRNHSRKNFERHLTIAPNPPCSPEPDIVLIGLKIKHG